MESEFKNNEKKYIKTYKRKGYTTNYVFHRNRLVDVSDSKEFTPQEVYVIARYLFEGIKNPEDTSILFVLKTINGSKGIFILDNNTIENSDPTNFFNAIPKENISGIDNLL